MFLCPLFPLPLRRLLEHLCSCSALGRRPTPSPHRCYDAQRVRFRALSPSPIPPVLRQPSETHLRMSVGKVSDKEETQYTGKYPDEGSAPTSRDTTTPENEVHSSDHTHRKSIHLNRLGDRGNPRTSILLSRYPRCVGFRNNSKWGYYY